MTDVAHCPKCFRPKCYEVDECTCAGVQPEPTREELLARIKYLDALATERGTRVNDLAKMVAGASRLNNDLQKTERDLRELIDEWRALCYESDVAGMKWRSRARAWKQLAKLQRPRVAIANRVRYLIEAAVDRALGEIHRQAQLDAQLLREARGEGLTALRLVEELWK